MKTITLTEDEIKNIKSFIKDAQKLPIVEAVYIVAFLDEQTNSEKIEIITILNYSLAYKERMGEDYSIDEQALHATLQNVSKKYEREFPEKRVSIASEYAWNYSLALMHYRERMAEMSLLSGTIIFDRFGDIKENQERISELLTPYTNILDIDNLSLLEDEPVLLKRSIPDDNK